MTQSKPNIVFIVLDTHRVDRLGCYGYPRGTSPNLDTFAHQGTLFEHAISPAQWTIPSHASMFSGEYPSTHGTLQASDALGEQFPTVTELLRSAGYHAIGFCNNPLVGVLDNGLRRGFEAFYNYGGAIPSPLAKNGKASKWTWRLRQGFRALLDSIATPIQKAVAASPEVFQVILTPWLVPLWTQYANFKGDSEASIRDATEYLRRESTGTKSRPIFLFLNLMGTHLPYNPPEKFVREQAPIVRDEREARAFMRFYNTQARRWLLPLEEPFKELESQTLSQMYDAEVAYQDDLLQRLLALLDEPEHRQNTLVVIVSDHGEMLGEHRFMGHGLGLYQELIHVPLILRFPGQENGKRVETTVSTRQLFHTLLSEAGIDGTASSVDELSLRKTAFSLDMTVKPVISEAYPPLNVIKTLENHNPSLMEAFHCHEDHWALFRSPHKLLRVANVGEDLFDLSTDPEELSPLGGTDQGVRADLSVALDRFLEEMRTRKERNHGGGSVAVTDKKLKQRLRGLGYLE